MLGLKELNATNINKWKYKLKFSLYASISNFPNFSF